MVYYRKYRPQLISELDLETVRGKLAAILSSGSIPHAFLFAGPKGLGKTSSARILAKAINCEKKKEEKKEKNIEPCNKCSACISITNGSAVDVLEIDAASNRGIDEIRDLKERIKFAPSALHKKVYIIDEVHMLTTEAFNALLKTLEEPPSHVVFILATTEIGKLPATILSRVFLVQFEKPSKEEIERSLLRVARGENLELEDRVMDKIGELSDGAFRDGAKILEELSLQSKGKKITLALLESLYKTGSIDNSVKKLIELCLKKNSQESLEVIDTLSSQNVDFKLVIEKMAEKLHSVLLDYVYQNKTHEVRSIQTLLSLLDEAYKDLKGAVLPQLPLEIAVIEYSIEDMEPRIIPPEEKEKASVLERPVHSEDKKESSVPQVTGRKEPANDLPNLFRQLVDSVNSENKILAGLLRGCKIEDSSNGTFVIKAPSTFHLGKLAETKNSDVIHVHMRKLLQKEVAIEIKN